MDKLWGGWVRRETSITGSTINKDIKNVSTESPFPVNGTKDNAMEKWYKYITNSTSMEMSNVGAGSVVALIIPKNCMWWNLMKPCPNLIEKTGLKLFKRSMIGLWSMEYLNQLKLKMSQKIQKYSPQLGQWRKSWMAHTVQEWICMAALFLNTKIITYLVLFGTVGVPLCHVSNRYHNTSPTLKDPMISFW